MRRLSLKSTLFGVDPTRLLFGRTSERETHQLNPDDEAVANRGVVP